ncbi:hypothetical protein PB01_15365 [Psychrobacillus glaciei]|uniref:Uncharacterized protein n=1 Tax=Psychrobacillus glaciei TaxID=2283160 RepID=A0A5J6SQ77_9BACI|nr:hypothetical protein [Psychrobacillus glaciei]QFG00092.1 hypothetical protein PB01_15365 [Psychrobacillus glaciei]
MNLFSYKVLGFVFLISLGFIYALLRIGQMTGEVSEVATTNLYFTIFFSLFFIMSLILFIYGFKKDK